MKYEIPEWKPNGRYIVTILIDSDGTRVALRYGHELQRDGIGLGKVMTWKDEESALMYCDLLNSKESNHGESIQA